MIEANEILNGLQQTVDEYSIVAILWHVVFYVLLLTLLLQWKPSGRLLASFLALPLISVAVLAWTSGNPFNGSTFSILSLLVIIATLKAPANRIKITSAGWIIPGVIMIVFGLFYPHFIEGSLIEYTYRSPLGLIPCPTLSLIIGFMLLYNGFGSKLLKIIFICFGLFYGIFGVLKLSVYVDLVLLFGTLVLCLQLIFHRRNDGPDKEQTM